MPLYNSADTIEDAVQSVLSQKYELWELIIIDDNSTDNSIEIIKRYSAIDSRIFVYKTKKNVGSGQARNIGISHSSGKLIAFLDSDDIWLSNKLKTQVKMFENKKVTFVCSGYQRFHTITNRTESVGVPDIIHYKDLLKTNYIGCLTVILRKSAFKNLQFPDMRKRQDYALWLTLLKDGAKVYCSNEVLARYRYGHISTTSNKLKSIMYTWRVYREFLEFNFLYSVYYFVQYLVRGFFRTKLPKSSIFLGFSYLINKE